MQQLGAVLGELPASGYAKLSAEGKEVRDGGAVLAEFPASGSAKPAVQELAPVPRF